jgi:NAD(P)-dependent dehydrogenase (short-subunit alcohol dehydrogenase family)
LRELQQAEAEALSVPGDVSKEASVRGMVEVVMGEFGRIDVLVTAERVGAALSKLLCR